MPIFQVEKIQPFCIIAQLWLYIFDFCHLKTLIINILALIFKLKFSACDSGGRAALPVKCNYKTLKK